MSREVGQDFPALFYYINQVVMVCFIGERFRFDWLVVYSQFSLSDDNFWLLIMFIIYFGQVIYFVGNRTYA